MAEITPISLSENTWSLQGSIIYRAYAPFVQALIVNESSGDKKNRRGLFQDRLIKDCLIVNKLAGISY